MKMNKFGRIVIWVLALMTCVVSVASANVSKGENGSEVSTIQQRLVDLGYLTGKVDGSFGNMTEQAVKDFQKAIGLPETGEVDSTTQSLLFDPSIHASFFQKAMLDLINVEIDPEDGCLYRGGKVYWYCD